MARRPVLLAFGSLAALLPAQAAERSALVHSVTDISHEFTFYFDGRFARNYIEPIGGIDARNWATLHTCDLGNVNLLVLQSGGTPCPYAERDIATVRAFLHAGGGVAVLGDHDRFRDEKDYRLNELARAFGAEFSATRAQAPLKSDGAVETYGGKTLQLGAAADWEVLVADANGRPVMVRRAVGAGSLLLASRALAGRQPDAKDPINAARWQRVLAELAAGKRVERRPRPRGAMPENESEHDGLRIRCSDYLQPMADTIFEVFRDARPRLEEILGVGPHPGMLTSLILLPTGGGGFSSGSAIGLGVWWGGFPAERYGMVELLGHEATHSWVLPFAEPMWNEGLATYVGITLARELGHDAKAEEALRGWIAAARRHDPDMRKLDLAADKDVPHAVRMAKPMWIWDELRRERPDVLARYFRAKRRLVAGRDAYTADDCVAVLSVAMERDLFPWFRSLGTDVDRSRTTIAER